MSHDAAVLTAKSLLEKPLSLLTEDDIAQITREECRRFLKERGMRRPSWNKSQAIQQVISLKALLEDRSDSDDPSAAVRLSQMPLDSSHGKETPSVLSSAKDPSPYRRRDHPIPPFSTAGDDPILLPDAVDGPLGQLTIFYGGKVNVYDDVPSDRARDILQMAGSSDPCDAPVEAPAPSGRPLLNRFTPAYNGTNWAVPFCGIGHFASTPPGMMQRSVRESADDGRLSREQVPECPTSRKASLKRYLAKRKDRFKGRRIIEGMPSSSIELMCLSQNLSEQGQNELSSRSNSSSSLQPGLPRPLLSRCTSIETKKLGIYFDINDDGN